MTIYADPATRPRRPGGDPPRRPRASRSRPARKKPKDPIWAKLCVIMGALVMVVAGAAVVLPRVLANWAVSNIPRANLVPQGLQGKDISGPINFLLLGMDQRLGSNDLIRADTIIIVHIPADHQTAYLVSLPRDAEVQIPAYPDTGFRGELTKINAAFAFGCQKNGQGDYTTPAGSAVPR